MAEQEELLFFDTFAHENSEELNLDLVQFPKPVYVTEVRIIPLGARVQADFPGGVRLGATNPSQFQIEFFVNDLGKPGASTFESLGGFEYNQNGCINLECVPNDTIRKIPTDGLVLRGWYTTITLAVYGTLTANITEQIIQPVVNPSIPTQPNTIPDVQQISAIENEWPQETIQPVPIEYSQQPATPYPQAYVPQEQYPQEYNDYYTEVPKDPRSYHHTPETEWETKSRGRSIERERDRDRGERERGRDITYQKNETMDREHRVEADRRERDREKRYSRSHSRDRERSSRDYKETSRDREHERDWDDRHEYRDRVEKDWDRENRDRERESRYKHQDYKRFNREEREERKRPHTPPMQSPKRPHTPHSEHKDLSPPDIDNLSEEDVNLKRQKHEKEALENLPAKIKTPPREIKENTEEVTTMDVEEFEPILSDEDILDDNDHYPEIDFDYTAFTNNDDLIKLFIPGTTDLQKYKKDPYFKILMNKIELAEDLKIVIGIADDFFKSSITKFTINIFDKLNTEIKEEFIHLAEKIIITIGSTNNFCTIVEIYIKTKEFDEELDKESAEIIAQTKCIADTLIDWIQIALSFDMANAQDQPGYKIRHLKCGIRLIEWCCSSLDFINLLWEQNFDIQGTLLNLYEQEYMAVSIKLMILRALDVYLQNKSTTEKFLLFNQGDVKKENGFLEVIPISEHNGYKILIEYVRKNPSVRLKFAFNSLLKKLNLYEVLYKLQAKIIKAKNKEFKINDIEFFVKSIEHILHMIQNGAFAVSQPKRFLPVAAQFEINRSDTKNVLVEYYKMHGLLQCISVLLTHPSTMHMTTIKTPSFDILQELTQTTEGLQYLSDNIDTVNLLLKCLLQHEDEFGVPIEIKSHYLGLNIAYKLQCLYHIEYLLDIGEKNNFDCDVNEVVDQLHGLFCLTFSNIGKLACAEVLGMEKNMDCLLQFFDILNMKDKSESQISKLKRSAGAGYIIDLIYFSILTVSNVPLLENYSKRLINILNHLDIFELSLSNKLSELIPYLKPFESSAPLNYDNIKPFVEDINKTMDSITNFPGQLIIALRIIRHLGISKYNNKSPVLSENPLNNHIELKYKHVILQLYSLEGIQILTKILQKICEHYDQPSLHTTSFVSNHGLQIINVVQPSVELLKQMLTYVIQCRNTNFKDLTTIPTLLQTYNLLKAFPSSAFAYVRAQKVCKDLIDTLLVYTQPVSEEVHEKDSLTKTLWTLMCGEVIKYATIAPYTFVSGLSILSELLPLPLPIQTSEELTEEEMSRATNLRKLWSAHLHSHSNNIQELINRMCTTTHQPLLNLLRRVCVQLADLAANSAIMIARGILDTVHNCISPSEDNKLQPCNGHTARLLNFLACLVTHGSLKCAVLQLLHNINSSAIKGDEKYPSLVIIFSQILKNNSAQNSHIQSQECILSIIQSFCDSEITLLQNHVEGQPLSSDIYLANALPTKELLLIFISSMTEHLMADNSFVTYLPIVRSYLLLTEHDYGFYYLRENLIKKTEPLLNVFQKLESNFSKDNTECLSTFNTSIEFLRVCSTLDEVEDNLIYKPRSTKMNLTEIRSLVGWKLDENTENDKKHPILGLEDILKKVLQEDATFESMLESLTSIINLLNIEMKYIVEKEINEQTLPAPETLLTQFAGRPVFTLTEAAEERLTSTYWLSSPSDEVDNDLENVSCDLTEICRQSLPEDVNLVREVEKMCRICPISNEQVDSKEKQVDVQKDKMKRPFITPSRGRGFPRTIPQRSDLFRSRPPNTSRPPSLHVDDFVALETCGAQPTGPTGYNKISRELLATTRVARGTRGRAFVASERAVQYRQMSWWGSNLGRGPYQ